MKKVVTTVVLGLLVLALGVTQTGAAPLTQATTKSLSTNYTVQNMGSDTATITVEYRKQYDGTTAGGTWDADAASESFTLEAGKSKVIAQYFDGTMTDGAGSATVSSSQQVAAIVNMLARSQTPTSGSYTAFQEGSGSFFAPFVFKNLPTSVGTINSQLIIMNVGAAATDVTVELVNGVTFAVDYTKTINDLPVGESYYYDQSQETNLPDAWYGSAKVSAASGGSIVVIGNQFTGDNGLLTYSGFAAGYTEWVVPLYLSRLANGYNSVIVVQNVSGSQIAAGGISVAFTPDPSLTGAAGTPFTINLPSALADNATWIVNPRSNSAFPVASYGAAKITASANVVAIVNQLVNEPPNSGDSALSYNAIPTNLTGTKVVVPLIMSRLANNYSTVLTIANLTNTAGTCDFTYSPDASVGGSDVTVNSVTLPAGGSIVHNHRYAGTHALSALWYGAASVVCTQPVAGVVNQLQSGGSGDPDLSYNAFTTTP